MGGIFANTHGNQGTGGSTGGFPRVPGSPPHGIRKTKKALVFAIADSGKVFAILCREETFNLPVPLPKVPANLRPVKLTGPFTKDELSKKTFDEIATEMLGSTWTDLAAVQSPAALKMATFVFVIEDIEAKEGRLKMANGGINPVFIDALFERDHRVLDVLK